jgi:hypothetical protein
MCLGVWWWPRHGSCRTPRSNETVSGLILYCMCSCAWHSRISWLNMKQENITLVRTRLTVRCLWIELLTNHQVLRPASISLSPFFFLDLWQDGVTFVSGARDASHAPSFSSGKFGKIFRNKQTINIFYNFTNDPFSTCGYLNHLIQILDILNPLS